MVWWESVPAPGPGRREGGLQTDRKGAAGLRQSEFEARERRLYASP
jgi:hypothetical protein